MAKNGSDELVDAICARIYTSDRVRCEEIPYSTLEVVDRLLDMYIKLVEMTLTKKQQKALLKKTQYLLKGDL